MDTTYLHTLAWWQALEEHGHVVPIHAAIGMGADKLLGRSLASITTRLAMARSLQLMAVTSSGGTRWSDPCPEQRRC